MHGGESGCVTERGRETDSWGSPRKVPPWSVSLSLSGSPLRFQRRFSTFSRRTAPLRDPRFLLFFSLHIQAQVSFVVQVQCRLTFLISSLSEFDLIS